MIRMSDGPQLGGSAKRCDTTTAAELLPLVYEQLRRLAAHKMAKEAAGHTLQPTALVHEVWLRLMTYHPSQFENRAHFFSAAAEAMRRILIDRARQKRAVRHGGGHQRVAFDEMAQGCARGEDQLLALNDALETLAAEHPLEAEVVKLRYFVGMTHEEAAESLGISPRTAKYYWAHARAWLYHAITTPEGPDNIR